ncbi:3-deoxy-D-arabinoheptulosonate-7-phosphate synthase [Halopseudomonas xinjiangensis]|uniref:Phospho-2-dehydro-3-deoxyheptonate aldolase n=1 Tax=Halopseudomonas xinjiangensis TaxID=487184 RepID=A0A1H1T9E0_9GAMM|nr:3-deoxy-7-phosphoheptulonate synthase [Halopseudomonas xinjiangensis]SDS56784.1 3-deoxy-D-arabinoheptulosonate-7-phosphate synthase [Halopseudomonas xinjiangensis]
MNAPVPAATIKDLPVTPAAPANTRRSAHPLPTPAQLRERFPVSRALAERIDQQRQSIRAVLNGEDDRLLVVTGPCSLHDTDSAIEYAERLAQLSAQVSDRMLLVMRAYVEKPRTTIGWKGMLYDPHLDGSGDMAEGLALSRRLMLALVELGLPVATELLQPLAAGYLDDLIGWAAIGARTSESQVHREMVSGLDVPVGFKNGTDGSLTIACDAMGSAAHPHQHFGVDELGRPALVQTLGNPDVHLVLRGGHAGPNYAAEEVAAARAALEKRGIAAKLIVDCSHANSGKDPLRQPAVLESVIDQRLAGDSSLRGVMIESHLFDGSQPLSGNLAYGVSVTDGCLGWAGTEQTLLRAADRLAGKGAALG